MSTFKIYTLGCKVNQYDTQVIRENFLSQGLEEIDNGQVADIYIINTCTVTQAAESKSLAYIHRAIRDNPKGKIYVTGCLTVPDQEKILDTFSGVQIIAKDKFEANISGFKDHHRAFLKVQDGCENFCSYCKVPFVRGSLKSRPLDDLIEEARRLVNSGFKEIVLCGICLGAYGRDLQPNIRLVSVIEGLEGLEGEFRIRLSSIEAVDIDEQLIKKFETSVRLCPHLHIPLQSGDNRILNLMRRRYSREYFIDLVKQLKQKIPLLSITTDVLVGFPSEDEQAFQNTLNCLKEIVPLRTHIFPFSPRKGTVAFDFKNKVKPPIIKQRIQSLKILTKELSYQYRLKFLNKELEILSEGPCGYTQNYIPVQLKDAYLHPGKLFKVKITKVNKTTTLGTVLHQNAHPE